MASDPKKLDPKLVEEVMKAAAAAKEEVLHGKTLEALLNVKPEDLIGADIEAEIIKGNAHAPGCWMHAPATVELFASATRRLIRVAEWAGMPVKWVEKVHARVIKGTKLLIITPARSEDLTALEVSRRKSGAAFNLISLLGDVGLTVETGYRERYDVAYVPKESPLWPALVIDLGQMKERRQESAAKAEEPKAKRAAPKAKQEEPDADWEESEWDEPAQPSNPDNPDTPSGSSTS